MRYLVWNIRHMREDKVTEYKGIFKQQIKDVDVAFFLECKKSAAAGVLTAITDVAVGVLSNTPKGDYANCSHKDDEGVVWLCPQDVTVTVNEDITEVYSNLGLGERFPVAFNVTRAGNTETIAVFHAEGPARQFISSKLNLLRNITVDILAGDFNFEPQPHLTLEDEDEDEDESDDDAIINKSGTDKRKYNAIQKNNTSLIKKRSKRNPRKTVMFLKEAEGKITSSTVNNKGKYTQRKRPIDVAFIRRERYHGARVRFLRPRAKKAFFELTDHLAQKIEI
jgi:hypothetical protein